MLPKVTTPRQFLSFYFVNTDFPYHFKKRVYSAIIGKISAVRKFYQQHIFHSCASLFIRIFLRLEISTKFYIQA